MGTIMVVTWGSTVDSDRCAFSFLPGMLEAVPGVKVLRVYGRTIEDQTFKQSLRTTLWTSQSTMDTACKDISLHFRIRESSNPHSSRIAAAEEAIMQLRKKTTSHALVIFISNVLLVSAGFRDFLVMHRLDSFSIRGVRISISCNPLNPSSDEHLISSHNITTRSNLQVMRVKEMITKCLDD